MDQTRFEDVIIRDPQWDFICSNLNHSKAWRKLGDKLQYTTNELDEFKRDTDNNPTKAMLTDWKNKREATIGELQAALHKINNHTLFTFIEAQFKQFIEDKKNAPNVPLTSHAVSDNNNVPAAIVSDNNNNNAANPQNANPSPPASLPKQQHNTPKFTWSQDKKGKDVSLSNTDSTASVPDDTYPWNQVQTTQPLLSGSIVAVRIIKMVNPHDYECGLAVGVAPKQIVFQAADAISGFGKNPGWTYGSNGNFFLSSNSDVKKASFSTGDVVAVRYNNNSLEWFLNKTLQHSIPVGVRTDLYPTVAIVSGAVILEEDYNI